MNFEFWILNFEFWILAVREMANLMWPVTRNYFDGNLICFSKLSKIKERFMYLYIKLIGILKWFSEANRNLQDTNDSLRAQCDFLSPRRSPIGSNCTNPISWFGWWWVTYCYHCCRLFVCFESSHFSTGGLPAKFHTISCRRHWSSGCIQ